MSIGFLRNNCFGPPREEIGPKGLVASGVRSGRHSVNYVDTSKKKKKKKKKAFSGLPLMELSGSAHAPVTRSGSFLAR